MSDALACYSAFRVTFQMAISATIHRDDVKSSQLLVDFSKVFAVGLVAIVSAYEQTSSEILVASAIFAAFYYLETLVQSATPSQPEPSTAEYNQVK